MTFTLEATQDPNWWRQACVYQIYPRSFCDANGDGIGDLIGITSKVPYLQNLGVDAVWLSPFYPSALKDGGYDVADYRDVDPKIGTLAEFDEMMKAFKEANIKVIVDVVPNHSSNDHVWFQEALRAGKGSPERERYIFRDGKGPDKSEPPTDWQAIFGGSTWDPVGDGQFYLHLFDSSQPDFNWDHPEVREDFIKTLRFWADRGVAGFRIDVAHGCVKDMSEPLPTHAELMDLNRKIQMVGVEKDLHPLWDRSEVLEVYKSWRKVFDEYDPPLTAVAEAWVASDRKHHYASPEGLGQSFSFDMLMCNYKFDEFKKTIAQSLVDAKRSGSSSTWVLSNHDVVRHATRYGLPKAVEAHGTNGFAQFAREWLMSEGTDPVCEYDLGLKKARGASLMLLGLPGSAYIYQGEELGLHEVVSIPDEQRQDPSFWRTRNTPTAEKGRDGCRVPIPWTKSTKNFGFGDGKPAHLPQPDWYGESSVEAETGVEGSTLEMYTTALGFRKKLQSGEDLEWVDAPEGVIRFKREGWEVVFNMAGEDVDIEGREVLVKSGELVNGKVGAHTSVWLKV